MEKQRFNIDAGSVQPHNDATGRNPGKTGGAQVRGRLPLAESSVMQPRSPRLVRQSRRVGQQRNPSPAKRRVVPHSALIRPGHRAVLAFEGDDTSLFSANLSIKNDKE